MMFLAYKVTSILQNRYRLVRIVEAGDKTIYGRQVVLEFESFDFEPVVTVERDPLTGNLSTDYPKIRVVGEL